jgi:hypothetical protein
MVSRARGISNGASKEARATSPQLPGLTVEQHFRNYGDFDMATATSHIRILDGEPATGQQRRQRGDRTRATTGQIEQCAGCGGSLVCHRCCPLSPLARPLPQHLHHRVTVPRCHDHSWAAHHCRGRASQRHDRPCGRFVCCWNAELECTESSPPSGSLHFKELGVSCSGGLAIASEVGVVALVGIWTYRHWRRQAGDPD